MMHIKLAIVAIAFACVHAFKDTSPFILLSSSPPLEPIKQFPLEQLKSRIQVLDTAISFLSRCPSKIYFVLIQPSVSAQELSDNATFLKKITKDPMTATKISIRESIGLKTDDGERIVGYLEEKCSSKRNIGPTLSEINKQKKSDDSLVILKNFSRNIKEDKYFYKNMLSSIAKESNFTIILVTTPPEPPENRFIVDESYNEPLHIELKREFSIGLHNISSNSDLRPLFEKYQFFSPGLFVGILVTTILVAILTVGIRAISGLEISYGALSKEPGPLTQK